MKKNIKKQKICIIGYGNFGIKAIKKIKKKFSENVNTLVTDIKKYNLLINNIFYLMSNLKDFAFLSVNKKIKYDWVIPVVPYHLFLIIFRKVLSNKKNIDHKCLDKYKYLSKLLFKKILKITPNGRISKHSQIHISCSNWLCFTNCLEVAICKKVKKNNKIFIYKILKKINISKLLNIVMKSDQLFQGLGGYKLKSLIAKLENLKANKNKKNLIVSTACKCHAVIDFI